MNLIRKRMYQIVDMGWRAMSRLNGHGGYRGMPLVSEDPSLCEELMRDMRAADGRFQPTNFWQIYQDRLMPVIRKEGILRFRASRIKVYSSFGVSQLPSTLRSLSPLPVDGAQLKTHPSHVIDQSRRALQAFYEACFFMSLEQEPKLFEIGDSGYGCPADLFSPPGHSGGRYTLSFLRYFNDYLWLRRHVDMNGIRTIVELGGGYGGQAEVIKKLFPDIHYVIVDIPPQLYVAEQYLKSVFPGRVNGYRETKAMRSIDLNRLKGITLLASWQLESLAGQADLFLSSTTFQEMEPDTVKMYLGLIQPRVSRYVYLTQMPEGQHVAAKKGMPGVLEPVTTRHYVDFLDRFSLKKEDGAIFFATGQQGIPYICRDTMHHFLFEKK